MQNGRVYDKSIPRRVIRTWKVQNIGSKIAITCRNCTNSYQNCPPPPPQQILQSLIYPCLSACNSWRGGLATRYNSHEIRTLKRRKKASSKTGKDIKSLIYCISSWGILSLLYRAQICRQRQRIVTSCCAKPGVLAKKKIESKFLAMVRRTKKMEAIWPWRWKKERMRMLDKFFLP